MRSLGPIRTRVDRLASAWLPAPESPTIIHEQCQYDVCPICRADLTAHALALAVASARADQARGVAARVYDYTELTTCPRCGAPLPFGVPTPRR